MAGASSSTTCLKSRSEWRGLLIRKTREILFGPAMGQRPHADVGRAPPSRPRPGGDHRAGADSGAIEGGSPKSIRQTKPPRYPSERREAWRPARAIPGRKGKAERIARWLDGWAKQDRDVREFMDSCRTA